MQDAHANRNPHAHVPEFAGELRALYEELDRRIDALLTEYPGSACGECGKCCTFPAGVPVLYASTMEHAYLASGRPTEETDLPEGQCPHFERRTKHCTAREYRPAVCRTHFCDETMTSREAQRAAQALAGWAEDELRQISDAHRFEWCQVSVLE